MPQKASKKKTRSVRWWKKKAWVAFSNYIRLRDCVKTTETTEYGLCITCGHTSEKKNLHAGHFIPGRRNSILFDERNCHAQCYACNMHLHGNTLNYLDKMLTRYGRHVVDELRLLDKQVRKFTIGELKDIRDHYNELADELIDGVPLEQLEVNNA